MTPSRRAFLAALLLIVGSDQASKAWIRATLRHGTWDELTLIPGFLSFIHARNDAAAFGLFSDVPNRRWIFLALTASAVPVIAWLLSRLPATASRSGAAFGAIVGGAIGNAIDRAYAGHVTDFIRVYTEQPALAGWLRAHVGTADWPTFNIADAALIVGTLAFVGIAMFPDDAEDPESDDEGRAMQ